MGMLYELDDIEKTAMFLHPDGSVSDKPSSATIFQAPLLNEYVDRKLPLTDDEFSIGESLWHCKTGEPARVKAVDLVDGSTIYVMEYTAAISRGITARYHAAEMGDTWTRIAQGSTRRANRA